MAEAKYLRTAKASDLSEALEGFRVEELALAP